MLAGAGLLYFVVIPLGIPEPDYAYQSPSQCPKVIAITIGALAAVLFVLEWQEFQDRNVEKITPWFFVCPVVTGVYALALGPVGFPLSTAVILATLLVIFGERRPLVFGGVACITAAGIHVVFVYLLNIPLPRGILG